MKIAGIDPSTFTAITVMDLSTDTSSSTLLNYPKLRGVERAQSIARAVRGILVEHDVKAVAIEGFAFNNHHTLVTMVEVSTMLKAAMLDLKIPWWEVPPTVLKKWTTGKGNAKKDGMAESVKERWGYVPRESKGDDLVDSYALSRLCVKLLQASPEAKLCTFVPPSLSTSPTTC